MDRHVGKAAYLLVAFLTLPLFASSSLILTDGQIIKGTSIARQGDIYLVTTIDGATATFPVALVKEIRLQDEPTVSAEPTAPGILVTGPKTLAGPELKLNEHLQDPLKVFGQPSVWPKNVVDTTWVPTSAFDLDKDVLAASRATWSKSAVDTTWRPKSAYDFSKDVLAPTRSTWSKSAVDTTWTPQNSWGFKPLWPSAAPKRPETAPVPLSSAPYTTGTAGSEAEDLGHPTSAAQTVLDQSWACAERLFAGDNGHVSSSVDVGRVTSAPFTSLGLTLYEAHGMLAGARHMAVFTVGHDQCRLVGGDTEAITGMNLSSDHAFAENAASLNAAIAPDGGARVPIGVGDLEYAVAVVSLADPNVSGTPHATLKLIRRSDELASLVDRPTATCPLTRAKRRREERAASHAFTAPGVEPTPNGNIAAFLTWSSAGGVLYRNSVTIGRSGVVSAKREVVASHVGPHFD